MIAKKKPQQTEESTEEKENSRPKYHEEIIQLDPNTVRIGKRDYWIKKNYRDAFQTEKLQERYSDILNRYDYIVGDWGYDQLRLRGFFNEKNRSALPDSKINTLQDYLYEYCNFGCAYFVLERKVSDNFKKKEDLQSSKNKKIDNAYISEKQVTVSQKNKKEIVIKNRKPKELKVKKQEVEKVVSHNSKRNFTIRQKGK